MVLGKLPVPGRSTHTFDCGRARAYYACSRSGGVVLTLFLSSIISWTLFHSSAISFSLSLGDGPI